jgi:hypothetical protein
LWDDLDATGGLEEERGSSGLTLVDSIGGSSTWSLWNRIAKKLEAPPAPPPPVRGLYLYGQRAAARCCCSGCAALTPPALTGGVGTGKTMLMDIFGDSLPPGARKKRIHFLDFMLDVHRRLRNLKNVADPLYAVAQGRAPELVRVSDGGSRASACAGVHAHAQARRRPLGALPRRVHGDGRGRRHDPEAPLSAPF